MYQIAIFNRSGCLSDKQVEAVVPSLQKYLNQYFTPAWNISAQLTFFPSDKNPDPTMWWLGIWDNADVSDALGYHEVNANGMPIGKVFAHTDLIYRSSWTVTLSHECVELLRDPSCNAIIRNSQNGAFYMCEIADPVESDSDGIEVDGVLFSNFVYPAWYQLGALGPYDAKHLTTAPFQVRPTGYQMINLNGQWQQLGRSGPMKTKGRNKRYMS